MSYSGFTVMKIINIIYPVVIVTLLLFSYVTSALACRGESKVLVLYFLILRYVYTLRIMVTIFQMIFPF